jgi:hypothetical protein
LWTRSGASYSGVFGGELSIDIPSRSSRWKSASGWVSRTCDPIKASHIMLSKHQAQLSGMFLNMPHAVQLELQEAGLHPFKYTALMCFLFSQRLDGRLAPASTLIQVRKYLLLCIRLFRQGPYNEGGRRHKTLLGARQKEIQPAERMKGDKPELAVSHVIGVFPQDRSPQMVRAQSYRVIEHIDSGPILLPNARSPLDIHDAPLR